MIIIIFLAYNVYCDIESIHADTNIPVDKPAKLVKSAKMVYSAKTAKLTGRSRKYF